MIFGTNNDSVIFAWFEQTLMNVRHTMVDASTHVVTPTVAMHVNVHLDRDCMPTDARASEVSYT